MEQSQFVIALIIGIPLALALLAALTYFSKGEGTESVIKAIRITIGDINCRLLQLPLFTSPPLSIEALKNRKVVRKKLIAERKRLKKKLNSMGVEYFPKR